MRGPPINTGEIIEVTNKLLNDKLREKFEDVNRLTQEIEASRQQLKRTGQGEIENYQLKMEERINRNVF